MDIGTNSGATEFCSKSYFENKTKKLCQEKKEVLSYLRNEKKIERLKKLDLYRF